MSLQLKTYKKIASKYQYKAHTLIFNGINRMKWRKNTN